MNRQHNTVYLPFICANFVYDLNGSEGPNTAGKDVGFMTAFYSSDTALVAPMPVSASITGNGTWSDGAKKCREADAEYRLPNVEELTSLAVNSVMIADLFNARNDFWSATSDSADKAWSVMADYSTWNLSDKTSSGLSIYCVRR